MTDSVNDSKRLSEATDESRLNLDVIARRMPRKSPYLTPETVCVTTLKQLLAEYCASTAAADQSDMFIADGNSGGPDDINVFYAGNPYFLERKCVSIVGTREVSEAGYARATRLAKELAVQGIVVVSGLAKGVDTAALTGAISVGGKTIAVIGTPLDKAYPAENKVLQEEIWRSHLLMTPFAKGEAVFQSNFPKRNRMMAAISDATVIVEASDTSGTLHQARECQRLGRPLFIMRSVAENYNLKWPKSFLNSRNCYVLDDTDDILKAI
jgi:DNA processing protein